MNKFITIFILLFTITVSLPAQNAKVENIIQTCKSIDGNINEEVYYGGYWVYTINFSSNHRAIGLQLTTIKFYYEQPRDSLVEKGDKTDMLDIYRPPVKIKVEYNVAASQKIKIEYYSDEKGKLIYYHYLTQGVYTNGEENFYFEKEKPVKIKSAALNSDSDILEKYKDFERDSDFTKDDLSKCKKIFKKWDDYKKMFEQLIYFEKLEK